MFVARSLQWKEEWPDAVLYGCPGLKEKKPEEGYDEEVGADDTAPASWLGEIEAAHMKHEAVPIFNVPFFSEARTCPYLPFAASRRNL